MDGAIPMHPPTSDVKPALYQNDISTCQQGLPHLYIPQQRRKTDQQMSVCPAAPGHFETTMADKGSRDQCVMLSSARRLGVQGTHVLVRLLDLEQVLLREVREED